jgi:hypothetical protein
MIGKTDRDASGRKIDAHMHSTVNIPLTSYQSVISYIGVKDNMKTLVFLLNSNISKHLTFFTTIIHFLSAYVTSCKTLIWSKAFWREEGMEHRGRLLLLS